MFLSEELKVPLSFFVFLQLSKEKFYNRVLGDDLVFIPGIVFFFFCFLVGTLERSHVRRLCLSVFLPLSFSPL